MNAKKLTFIVSGIAIAMSILTIEVRETVYVYDCSIAEDHPDVPQEIKEECRKARMKKKAIIV